VLYRPTYISFEKWGKVYVVEKRGTHTRKEKNL
jgi:hypothetical protein